MEGKITGITKFGAFVQLDEHTTGMVHISEVAVSYVKEIRDYIQENQMVKVKVLSVSPEGKISLSMKKAVPVETVRRPRGNSAPPAINRDYEWQPRQNNSGNFEDMMLKFKQASDEKMSDLKKASDVSRRGGASKRGGSRK